MRKPPLRLLIPSVVVLAAGVWAVVATSGLREGTVYYYTPSEVSALSAPDRPIRVAGRVQAGSVRWDARAGVLRFMLTDGKASLPVVNAGAPPDLFGAGRDAVVEGRLTGGVLRSDDVIVKHDANYRAPSER